MTITARAAYFGRRVSFLAGLVRRHGEVEFGGLGGDLPVHEARHRKGRLAREGGRFLPGSEAVLVPLLEVPDESDQVAADVPVASAVEHDASHGLHVLNLVEGEEAIVESPTEAFEPFNVHYAETFIVPAAAGGYRVRPADGAGRCATVRAAVRTEP